MSADTQLLVFHLDSQRYALRLAVVDRVVRAAAITPLPNAPKAVLGILDVGGQILPVLNLRRRFALPERDVQLTDHFLLAKTPERPVVLVIDFAEGVVVVSSDEIVNAETIFPGLARIDGIVRMQDGLVLIHDLPHFLSTDESLALEAALREETFSHT